jgi:integrase
MAALGDRPVSNYTRQEVQAYIDSLDAARDTIKSNLKQIRVPFSMALEAGQLARSPARGVKLPNARGEKRIQLITPGDLQRLLDYARQHDRPMSRLLAIAFFTGMRMSMIAPPPYKRLAGEFLRADMFDLPARTIIIPAGIMKTGAELATDDAPDCLWPWLDGLKPSDFGTPQNTFNVRKAALCRKVGVKWPANLHRRSFGSYFSALRGRDYAAKIMGDRTESVFTKHYEVAAFKSVAEQYAQISPTG